MKALGMMEVYGFPAVITCADIAAKAADVKVIAFDRNRPFGKFPVPLIMQFKIEGNISAVKAAMEAAEQYAKSIDKFIVSYVIPNPSDGVEKMAYKLDINKDKFNKNLPKTLLGAKEIQPKSKSAIGIVEVEGLVASIAGLDSLLKAADVRLIHSEKRLGGRLVSFVVTGSVSAVTAAVESGKNTASGVGKVYGETIIANPHDEVLKFFDI